MASMTWAGSPCPITDHKMVLVNPWVPHANWRDVSDPPITILALYLEASYARDGSGHVVRRPFKRPSGNVGGARQVPRCEDRSGDRDGRSHDP